MGRETKLLLALLGLLAGVFLGVVSMKLFVPRPPAGAGPDVHGDIATAEAQMLVEPPELGPPAVPADFTATAPPPRSHDAASAIQQASPARSSRFGGADAARDPFVVAASYEQTEPAESTPASPTEPAALAAPAPPADLLPPPDLLPPAHAQPPPDLLPPAHAQPPPDLLPPPSFERSAPPPAAPLGETYVAQTGDSWWSLAERAYGDGRLYRALFAWNRMLDPRVSLAPGTRLEIPPAAKLGASWPGLLPRD